MRRAASSPAPRTALLLVAGFAFAVHLAGCSSWNARPELALPLRTPVDIDGVTRLTLKSGEEIVVEYPSVAADTIRGIRIEKDPGRTWRGRAKEHRSRYAVATSEVARIEKKEFDAAKTGLFVIGTAAAFLALVAYGTAF